MGAPRLADFSWANSIWTTLAGVVAASLLISPTFAMGFVATSRFRAMLAVAAATAYGAIFRVLFQGQTPVGLPDVTAAYEALTFWTVLVGCAAPFAAGFICRVAWNMRTARPAIALVAAAFTVLASGAYFLSSRTEELAAAANVASGRTQVLATMNAEAAGIWAAEPGSSGARAARYVAARTSARMLGVQGPKTLDDFVTRMGARPSAPVTTSGGSAQTHRP